mgnify:CR=1 FL=1
MAELKQRRILYTAEDLAEKVKEIGRKISQDYAGKDLIVVGVLKGSLYFFADLTRAIDVPIGTDVIAIGNIQNTTSQTGIVRITKDLDLDITGKHVLVIEDIIRMRLPANLMPDALFENQP